MIQNKSQRLFVIFTALLLVVSLMFLHQTVSVRNVSQISESRFEELLDEITSDDFSPEKYWELRERYSPGTFLRDEEYTEFHETFRIVGLSDVLTPLFYYESKNIRSIEGVVPVKVPTLVTSFIEEFEGEVLFRTEERAVVKVSDTEYVLLFLEPIETMQAVVGMFDYISSEKELLTDQRWYHSSYISR